MNEENCATSNGLKHSDTNACTEQSGKIVGPEIYLNQTAVIHLTAKGITPPRVTAVKFLMKNLTLSRWREEDKGEAFEEKILGAIRELEEELSSTVSVEYAVTRSFGMIWLRD